MFETKETVEKIVDLVHPKEADPEALHSECAVTGLMAVELKAALDARPDLVGSPFDDTHQGHDTIRDEGESIVKRVETVLEAVEGELEKYGYVEEASEEIAKMRAERQTMLLMMNLMQL